MEEGAFPDEVPYQVVSSDDYFLAGHGIDDFTNSYCERNTRLVVFTQGNSKFDSHYEVGPSTITSPHIVQQRHLWRVSRLEVVCSQLSVQHPSHQQPCRKRHACCLKTELEPW